MKITHGRLVTGLLVVCAASMGSAQNTEGSGSQVRPAIAFPPTPTPAPKAEPLSVEQLDTLMIPSQFLERTSSVLAIAYNGFRRSQVDPCGCVTHQLGGLDKEARILQRIDELKIPAIQVDAGGFVRDMADTKLANQSKYLLKGLGKIGYDAVNVGFTDLALSPEDLKAAAKEAGISLISANINTSDGKLVFDPYLIKDVTLADGKTLKVGILGVTRPRVELSSMAGAQATPAVISNEGSSETLTISDPVAAINKYATELAAKSDFVIVLDYDRRSNVDKTIEGLQDKSAVNVMVLGENSQIQGSVQALGGIQVVSGGYEGRQVGTLYVELKDNKVASTWNRHIEVLQTIPSVAAITAIIEEAHKAAGTSNSGATTPVPASGKLDLSTP